MKRCNQKKTTHPMLEELIPLFTGEDGKFNPGAWWWGADTFVVKLIALAAKKLREDGNGYPGDTTQQEWHARLQQIEQDLLGYGKFYPETQTRAEANAAYERTQDALRRFADDLADWWD